MPPVQLEAQIATSTYTTVAALLLITCTLAVHGHITSARPAPSSTHSMASTMHSQKKVCCSCSTNKGPTAACCSPCNFHFDCPSSTQPTPIQIPNFKASTQQLPCNKSLASPALAAQIHMRMHASGDTHCTQPAPDLAWYWSSSHTRMHEFCHTCCP